MFGVFAYLDFDQKGKLKIVDDLDIRIAKERKKLAYLKKLKREQINKKLRKKSAPARRRGRPPETIDLVKAEKLAGEMPLADVALRFGVARSTLYRKGITRKGLDKIKANVND